MILFRHFSLFSTLCARSSRGIYLYNKLLHFRTEKQFIFLFLTTYASRFSSCSKRSFVFVFAEFQKSEVLIELKLSVESKTKTTLPTLTMPTKDDDKLSPPMFDVSRNRQIEKFRRLVTVYLGSVSGLPSCQTPLMLILVEDKWNWPRIFKLEG